MEQTITDPIMGPVLFVFFVIIVLHFPITIVTIFMWIFGQLTKKDVERYEKLNAISNDLGIKNQTFPPQKNLFYFSWLVYQKRVRDYYVPFRNTIRKMEGLSELQVKPDSIPRYFYGSLFLGSKLSDIISTEESAEPYIMVSQERVSRGKNNVDYYRVIYYRSNELDLPKCKVEPTSEFIDSIAPDEDDINFVSDDDFSKKFDLMGDDESKVRALFNENVRRIMINNPEWKWKLDGNRIMIKYIISGSTIADMQDIKPSLGELALFHNELKTIDITDLPTEEEIAQDTPEEIIDKKLYNKRLTTFGCTMGCGTLAILFALPMFLGFFVRLDFEMLFLGLFYGVPGILLFLYGRSEWKRNKQLKAEGKVKDQ